MRPSHLTNSSIAVLRGYGTNHVKLDSAEIFDTRLTICLISIGSSAWLPLVLSTCDRDRSIRLSVRHSKVSSSTSLHSLMTGCCGLIGSLRLNILSGSPWPHVVLLLYASPSRDRMNPVIMRHACFIKSIRYITNYVNSLCFFFDFRSKHSASRWICMAGNTLLFLNQLSVVVSFTQQLHELIWSEQQVCLFLCSFVRLFYCFLCIVVRMDITPQLPWLGFTHVVLRVSLFFIYTTDDSTGHCVPGHPYLATLTCTVELPRGAGGMYVTERPGYTLSFCCSFEDDHFFVHVTECCNALGAN